MNSLKIGRKLLFPKCYRAPILRRKKPSISCCGNGGHEHTLCKKLEPQSVREAGPRKRVGVAHVSSERGSVHVMRSTVAHGNSHVPTAPENIAWASFRNRPAP